MESDVFALHIFADTFWMLFRKESDFTLPAVQAVLYCNKLFEFERRYREKGYNYKKRYERRLKDEKPILEAFLSWLEVQKLGNNSKWNTALTYARNRKEDFMTYLEDGRCSLSNNLSENAIRPITVGKTGCSVIAKMVHMQPLQCILFLKWPNITI